MSYCLNPICSKPHNPKNTDRCLACGAKLLLRDRYQAIKSLGQGGFGATFLSRDKVLPGEPPCVIKQLRPSGTTSHMLQMARELFEREALTLGRIGNHPQLPRLLDYFEDGEQFYLVQEYIGGSTLQQEVKVNGVFSEAGVKQFLSEVLPLVEYIHSQKVIHRDIKPANLIRRTQDARLVMIDFGAVKNQISQTTAAQSGQTALTAFAIGTPGFAPPEQMAMRPVYASDIYAIGVTCIYLLTAKSPKDLEYNPTTGEMMWENLVEVSEHLVGVLRKMLEVSVRNRYQAAKEVLKDLEMEPYLDSLSHSVLVQSSNGIKGNEQDMDSGSYSSHNLSNAGVAQVAAAIRARKAKLGETMGVKMTGKKGVNNLTTSLNHKNNHSSPTRQLNSESLQTAYMKGRRDFSSHYLNMLNLQGADLSAANFHASKLEKTNLQKANLQNSDFGRASLNRANLRDANLTKAYLNSSDLEGADLRGANLSYAYLNNANLRGANLCGANMYGAKVSEEQIALAKTNFLTIRPNGKRGFM
ncbi:MAG: serine/threonine-protein kinase [Calothrix sp. MO_167.B42]|nr:serine/threonine-protein kinase [Calothrix sp. MO_167.B42]